ncbi:MAG: hypothetical protein QXM35_06030 [Candidatus Methanomethylicia archaeon]
MIYMRINVIDYEGATKIYDEDISKLVRDILPNITSGFEVETDLPWIADLEVHKALMTRRLSGGLKLIYSSGFVYKLDKSIGVLIPTIQLYAPKILTYDLKRLKGILYHEYLCFLHQCYHGLDWKPKIIWNPKKENAQLYYDIFIDLEKALEMALRCFKDEEALMDFLEAEVDFFLSTLTGKIKIEVLSGFPEVYEEVEPIEDYKSVVKALTIRPAILVDKIYTGDELPDLREKLSSRVMLLEKYLMLSELFREKVF